MEFQPITVKQGLFRLDRQAAHQGGDVLPRPSNEKLGGKLQTTGTRWRRRVDFVALETLWPLTTDRDEFATPGRDALTRPASSASRPPQQTDRPALPPPRGDVRRRSARWGRSAHACPRLPGTGVPLPSPRPPPSGAMKPSALELAARLCRALRSQDNA